VKRVLFAASAVQARWPGLPAFLATLAVYVALVPWLGRVWARSGDEPHYLLAAHSLAVDGDLDLTNNYAQADYHAFYTEYYLNPHVAVRADGQQILTHNLGLSLLIAPAYALGGLNGVLYFLGGVGALLAANVYLLGRQLTGSGGAAAVGWVAVAFTPPVVWYVFLVYPEIIGALVVVVAVRALLARTTGSSFGVPAILLVGLGLGALPWLATRFLPLYALLLAWAALEVWRSPHPARLAWLAAIALAVIGWLGYMAFSQSLYGSASPGASYAGPIPLAVERTFALLRVARGLVGWLLDNQRGVLVAAPIYAGALWGCVVLLRQKPPAGLGLLGVFAAALVPIAIWGGFWTGWEYSARFLVVALPALGAGVASLWAALPRRVGVPLVVTLLLPSVLTARAVVQQPLRGILSSPVELLKPVVDLEPVVPALARYAFLPAGREAGVGAPIVNEALASTHPLPIHEAVGALTWAVPAGESGLVIRQVDLPEFTFGWYAGRLPLAAPGALPDTAIARLKVFSPSGGDYFSQTIYARDLPADGQYRFRFKSPLYNGWGFPPTILVSATGQSELQVGMLSLEPDRWRSLGLAGVWLVGLALIGGALVMVAGRAPIDLPPRPPSPLRYARSLCSGCYAKGRPSPRGKGLPLAPTVLSTFTNYQLPITICLLVAALIYAFAPHARTLAALSLPRSTGTVVADQAAYGGQAMEASPTAGNDPGKLAASHPELYGPGDYRVSVSLARRADQTVGDPAASAVAVRVFASDAEALAQRWDIPVGHLPTARGYQRYGFEFHNPRQQALTFVVDYQGTAGVRLDRIIVEPIR
jgi:hypothetical protein